jgi:voltage-gated potassium channel
MRVHRAFIIAKEELVLFGATTLILLYLASLGIYYCESQAQPEAFSSIFACMWWAVTTLTTVGYGDMYPITTGGKLFTFFILIIGLGIVAIPTGLFASALSKAREEG